MNLSGISRRNRTLIIVLAVVVLLGSGIALATGGDSDATGDPPGIGETPLDRDPDTIGSGGEQPLPTQTPRSVGSDQPTVPRPSPTRTLTPATPVASRPGTPAPMTPTPVQGPLLAIPSIGVAASVETRGTDANNVMQTPTDPHKVAWYNFTATPGVIGNAVFAGHVDYTGVGRTVFWNLSSLKPGDEISFTSASGDTFRYQVTTSITAWADDAANPFVAPTTTEIITLITCTGDFDRATLSYNKRLIVQATRIP